MLLKTPSKSQKQIKKKESKKRPKLSKEKRKRAIKSPTIEQHHSKQESPKRVETTPLKLRKEESKKRITLKGNSIEAITTFADSSASDIAKIYPILGDSLNQKLAQEQKQEAKTIPKLVVKTSANQIKLPPKKGITATKKIEQKERLTESEPPQIVAKPHQEPSKPPNNSKITKEILKKEPIGGFLSWLKSSFGSFMKSIKTKDKKVNTSAGKTPSIATVGKANPNRIKENHTTSKKAVEREHIEFSKNIMDDNSQERIKPKEVNESRAVLLDKELKSTVTTAQNSDMQEYLSIELSDDVRKHADELLQPSIQKHTESLKQDTNKISKQRESEKQKEIKKSQERVFNLNKKANQEQESIIVARRDKIVVEQKKGLDTAHKEIEDFNKKADTKQKQTKQEVDSRVKKADSDANMEIKKGENQAREIKKSKEAEAESKKRELEKKQKDKSWWDRAVDVVKSAIKSLTDAIDSIFSALRSLVKKAIEKAKKLAVAVINKARTWIVERLDSFRKWAKSMVDKYLKSYFPTLAKKLNQAIDKVVDDATKAVNAVADSMIKGVEALADALSKTLDKVLSVFQVALKGAIGITGAILTGDFKEALKIAIQSTCDILGIDSKTIFDFLNRAGKEVMKILKSPAKFFNNLVSAVGKGIKNFQKNIKQHLISGLIGWLTGTLSKAKITLPDKFDFKGILSLVMQITGVSYDSIKAKIIKKYPNSQKIFDKVEGGIEKIEEGIGKAKEGIELIKEIKKEGVVAVLWKKIKEKIGDLKETVFSAIRNFIMVSVIKQGVTWLLSLLNPASAIVRVIKLLFDFVMFLVEKFTQIKDFVLSVYNSITAIASGALAKASKAVEDALAKSLPVIISLFATILGLGGIGKTIQKLIKKVSKPVDKVIDRIIERVGKYLQKMGKKRAERKKGKEKKRVKKRKIDKALGKKLTFSVAKESHSLWITTIGKVIKVMVASEKSPIEDRLRDWRDKRLKELDKDKQEEAKGLIEKAEGLRDKTVEKAKEEEIITNAILSDKKITVDETKKEKIAEETTVDKEEELQLVMIKLFEIFGYDLADVLILYRKYIKERNCEEVKEKTLNKLIIEEFNKIYEKAPQAKIEIDDLAHKIVNSLQGSVVKEASIKSKKRAMEKIINDYSGDPSKIKDLARNTIIVSDDKIGDVIKKLIENRARVKRVDGDVDPLGYSGVNSKIKTKSGIWGEIQVNTPEMIYAKESEEVARRLLGDEQYDKIAKKTGIKGGLGHKFYEEWRVLNPKSTEAQEIAKKSKKYYENIRKMNAN